LSITLVTFIVCYNMLLFRGSVP